MSSLPICGKLLGSEGAPANATSERPGKRHALADGLGGARVLQKTRATQEVPRSPGGPCKGSLGNSGWGPALALLAVLCPAPCRVWSPLWCGLLARQWAPKGAKGPEIRAQRLRQFTQWPHGDVCWPPCCGHGLRQRCAVWLPLKCCSWGLGSAWGRHAQFPFVAG